ncbi:MAG: FAD-dependent oxidoreductase [Pseudomonadota bacterium]
MEGSPMPARVLILGGGFGGMFTARALARLPAGQVTVELVDEHNYFVFQPLLPEVAAGTLNPSDAVTPFRHLLPGVKVNEARVVGIDLAARRVEVVHPARRRVRAIAFDHLVIALGTRVDLSRFPGLSEHAFLMKDLADAFALRNHVIDCLEQADTTDDFALKRRLLTFAVIGGGLSGVETMGEIEDMISRALRSYPRIRRDEVRLVLAEFRPRILPEVPARLADYSHRALGRRGVEVITGAGVKAASAEAVELADGRVVETATIIATIGNSPHPLVAELPLPRQKGRVLTDHTLRVEGREDVWAIGDCAWIPLDGDEFPATPPTAQAARQEAAVLAHNLGVATGGRGGMRRFQYRSRGQLASLGGRRGVAEIGGRQLTGWPAWVLWRAAYLGMLPGKAFKLRVGFDWLLDSLIPRNLVQIAQTRPSAVRRARFRAGDEVYRRGDWAGPVYVVESGTFERLGGGGERAVIGPGGHFGQACMRGERLRQATVRALEESSCLTVERADFDTLAACLEGLGEYVRTRRRG